MKTCLKKKTNLLGIIYLHENVILFYVFFSSTKGEEKKKKQCLFPCHDKYAWYIMLSKFCIIKKMRIQIKHNVYFKNPKFAKEVTHSKSIIGKQETRVKFEFLLFFLISGKNFFCRVQTDIDH